jgi:Mrp family chromosome partitioning ATPase
MSESCQSDCSQCGSECESRTAKPKSLIESPHEMSRIGKVIAVVSGKGGVGKSIVTSMLAVLMQRRQFKTAILDADITGPSIPMAFGLKERAKGSEMGIFPIRTKMGIEVMSLNLLVENPTDPVLWRGPILGNSVKQFWTDVIWNDVDIMFLDMPPGTGDVPLTVYQSIPIEGIIVVTTPQELVSMIVEKAVNMAKMMKIPILGIVENMSYAVCPDCDKQIKVFGESHIDEIAAGYGIRNIARLPMDAELANQCDRGLIELFEGRWLDPMADMVESLLDAPEGDDA